MKTLVVYYSLEGNCRFVADCISKAVDADVLELKPKKDIKAGGFMKFVWGGKQVIFGQKPELQQLEKNPLEYDLLFIGTPVWAGSYTPALKTFLAETNLQGMKVALFCCSAGGKGKVIENMKTAVEGSTVTGEEEFIEPLAKDQAQNAAKAAGWAKEVLMRSVD